LLDIFKKTNTSLVDKTILKNLQYNSDDGEGNESDADHIVEIDTKKDEVLNISNIGVKV
jgi:hypothetical protein